VVTLFVVGTSLGALGVLILMVVTSFAVIGYFRGRRSLEPGWNRTVAPALGGVLLLGVLWLVLDNFHVQLSVPRGDARSWALPSVFAVVALAGLLWGWYLKAGRPEVYRTIGLGANRVTGRTMSELDSELAGRPAAQTLPGAPRFSPGQTAPVRPATEIVRLRSTAELETVATVLAEAFHGDTPGEWLIPDPGERAMIYPAFFRILARHALRGAGEVYTTSDRTAVSIWYPAPYGVPNAGPADYDAQLLAAAGPYQPRFLAMDAAMQASHPMARGHHYLNFIAVRPAYQCRGIGSALLAHRLSDLHRQGIPAYLEATNRRNLALYLHHGFTVIGSTRVAGDGPTLYRMWREARGH
jgi:ribosomal protein S18 acetylase RimI-like enzyme